MEYVYGGGFELLDIDPNKLITLPQVRKTDNSKLSRITDSIEDSGLYNLIDVVKLNYEEFSNHIKFLNKLWRENINIDSFEPFDGYYYVVAAGHNRLAAIKMINKRNKINNKMRIKLHNAKTSEEILNIQLNENIHEEVKLEERAVPIIGIYHLGVMNGKWENKKEFIEQNLKRYSRDILRDILAFADLPLKAQEYVYSGAIPFAVGVELGRIYPLVARHEASFGKTRETLETDIGLYYSRLINELLPVKSIKKAVAKVLGEGKLLLDFFKPREQVQLEMLNLWNDGPRLQGEWHHQQRLDEYKDSLRTLTKMPFEYFMKLFTLSTDLNGEDHSTDVNYLQSLYNHYFNDKFLNPSGPTKKK